MLQTKKSVWVVEIKRRDRIGESVEAEVQAKVERMRPPRGIAVRTVLVYDGILAPEVEENGYFDYLVPVERLFDDCGDGD